MKKGMHAIRNIYNKLHHGQFLQWWKGENTTLPIKYNKKKKSYPGCSMIRSQQVDKSFLLHLFYWKWFLFDKSSLCRICLKIQGRNFIRNLEGKNIKIRVQLPYDHYHGGPRLNFGIILFNINYLKKTSVSLKKSK